MRVVFYCGLSFLASCRATQTRSWSGTYVASIATQRPWSATYVASIAVQNSCDGIQATQNRNVATIATQTGFVIKVLGDRRIFARLCATQKICFTTLQDQKRYITTIVTQNRYVSTSHDRSVFSDFALPKIHIRRLC